MVACSFGPGTIIEIAMLKRGRSSTLESISVYLSLKCVRTANIVDGVNQDGWGA
jgi:hypothetical protein